MIDRQQLFHLMSEAGFSTDWVGYTDAQETMSKYERFAELIEQKLISELPYRLETNLAPGTGIKYQY